MSIFDPLSQLCAILVVPRLGRKTLLALAFGLSCLCNVILGLVTTLNILHEARNTIILVTVCLLVASIGICQEPVTSLYMTEISNNAISGLVTLINNGFYLGYSYLLPMLIKTWPKAPTLFLCNSLLSFLALLYICLCLKETRGLSDI